MNDEYRYLNDEEMEALIAEVEKEAMIAPPVYLRDQIMDGIRADAGKNDNDMLERRKKARVQFLVYSAKIIAAAAAALCLTVIPMDTGRTMVFSSEKVLEERISKDVEKYKEEQQRIEEAIVKEIRDEQKRESNKDINTSEGGKFIRGQRGFGHSDNVSKIMNSISNLFGTEE